MKKQFQHIFASYLHKWILYQEYIVVEYYIKNAYVKFTKYFHIDVYIWYAYLRVRIVMRLACAWLAGIMWISGVLIALHPFQPFKKFFSGLFVLFSSGWNSFDGQMESYSVMLGSFHFFSNTLIYSVDFLHFFFLFVIVWSFFSIVIPNSIW